MTKPDVERLFAYSEWANRLVLDAAEHLNADQLLRDFQTGQHSVLETLVHMLGGEWIWLERWEGAEFHTLGELEAPFKMDGVSLAKVRAGWMEIETRRHRLLDGLTEETLHDSVSYVNSRKEHFSQPLIDQMLHVMNHATHHRGQVVGFLRALGATPPTTDLIHYFRSIE